MRIDSCVLSSCVEDLDPYLQILKGGSDEKETCLDGNSDHRHALHSFMH